MLRSGNPDGPVITAGQAEAVVEVLWPLREQALADNDIEMTNLLETGVAREFDNAMSRHDLAVPGTSLRRARPYSALSVFVPSQHRYPASFLAAVQSTMYAPVPEKAVPARAAYVDFLVLTRESAASHWRVALATGYQGTIHRDPLRQPGEHVDRAVDPPGWVNGAAVNPQLAAYWQHWRDHRREPEETSFKAGVWTTDRGAEIAEAAHRGIDPACRCRVHITYAADPARDGLYVFAYSETSVLACSTVRTEARYRRASRFRNLVQDRQRRNWGALLPPGSYRAITTHGLRQSCIEIGATPDEGLTVIGGNGDTVSAKGEK